MSDGDEVVAHPSKWALRPARPRLAEALSAVSDIEVETFEEMLATSDWRFTEANGFEWKLPPSKGSKLPQLRWTGPMKKRLMNAFEAWETLATRGVIPDSWVGDGGRRFHGAWKNAAPPSMWSAVAYACDPPTLSTVETLGREVAHRLEPWYRPHHQQVLWRIASPEEIRAYSPLLPGGPVVHTAAMALSSARFVFNTGTPPQPLPRPRRGRVPPAPEPPMYPWLDVAHPSIVRAMLRLTALAEHWQRAREETLAMLTPVRVADLADPWEPLLRLWRMGYGLDMVSRRSVTLLVPGVV